jgi:hypothetical protein
MSRIAVSGHRNLTARTVRLVTEAIQSGLLAAVPPVTGLTCLAEGADQIFARVVLDLGGSIEAAVPAENLRDELTAPGRDGFDQLLAAAATVHRLPFTEPTPAAHMAASELIVNGADELYAIWDGQPARGYAGTADVVAYACSRGVPVRVIWPTGAERG